MNFSEQMLDALHNEDLAEAQVLFEEALRKDEAEVLADLGENLMALGFLAEARRTFEELLTRFPAAEELYLPLAEIAIEDGKTDEAFDLLEKIAPDSDAYPSALLVMADLYQVLGIPEVSEAKLKEAEAILPDEPLIQFALAELAFSNGNFVEALRLYEQLQNRGLEEVTGISLNERIGNALNMEGEFEEAIPYLEQALADEQTDDRLFQLAFTYLQLKDNQKAIIYLQQLRALNPQYGSLYYYLGEALLEEEQLEEAATVLGEGISEDPYQVDLYLLAAEVAYRLHDPEGSEKWLQEALTLGEKTEEARLTLSNLYLSEGRYEEAIDALAGVEGDAQAEWNLAQSYNALEDFTQAALHYENAAEDLQHEPEFMKEYGIFLREEGQFDKAKALLTHYLAHEPGDLEVASLLDEM